MRIHNFLPLLLDSLKRWPDRPSEKEFLDHYAAPLLPLLQPMLEDFGDRSAAGLFEVIEGLNWEEYRAEALRIDPAREEKRLREHVTKVEQLLGVKLEGEAVLFGAFTSMDGYARFDRGTHRVYLGVDESHGRGAYLDILISHELAHVARESEPGVWTGWGLDPRMTHDEFTENIPVIEHLMNEGFSCVVSELVNPRESAWHYAYQTEDGLETILGHGPAVDKVVHAEVRKKEGDYGCLYDTSRYVPEMPRYAHYVWAWQWVKHLLEFRAGGDVRKLLPLCSKDVVEHALKFRLRTAL